MFKFIHSADIHLDSPLKGLEKYEGAPVDEIRGATRRALENLVQLAKNEQVDFVLIAGDVYDGNWKDHNTGLFFYRQMMELRNANIAVYLISGNHDAANKMTKSLRLPENRDGSAMRLSSIEPETVKSSRLDELGVAIHGRGFAKRDEMGNLAVEYPLAVAGHYNIGLLHTSLSGLEGHEPYAPCSIDDLKSKDYDYWALGHIHSPEVMCNEPHVVFSGNIQGRHIREDGKKGCYVVTVDEKHGANLRFEPLDVFRWHTLDINAEGAASAEEVVIRFSVELGKLLQNNDALPMAVRVIVSGNCDAHRLIGADPRRWEAEMRAAALDVSLGSVWVERVKWRTSPEKPLDGDTLTDGPLGDLLERLKHCESDDEKLDELSSQFDDLRKKLPRDFWDENNKFMAETSRDWLRETLKQVDPLLVARLHGHTQEAAK
ncbi:MAG: DNA repair exonuclease [Planctomycetes bacterium]|nr:DNA repair exonuclease [Planctomycetota bacterium]